MDTPSGVITISIDQKLELAVLLDALNILETDLIMIESTFTLRALRDIRQKIADSYFNVTGKLLV